MPASRSGIPARSLLAAVVVLLAGAAGCGEGELEGPVRLPDDVPVEYPLGLWDAGVEGTTVVRVRVDTVGRVDSVAVLESSGHPAFDSAAVTGARRLRFRPARRDGESVPVWAEVPVQFSRDSMP